jgi:hypothetical protein
VFSSGRGPVPGRIESAGVIRPLIELDVAVHARLSSSESFHSWQWIELVKLEAERLRVVGHGFRGNRDRRVVTVPSPSTAPYFFFSFLGLRGYFKVNFKKPTHLFSHHSQWQRPKVQRRGRYQTTRNSESSLHMASTLMNSRQRIVESRCKCCRRWRAQLVLGRIGRFNFVSSLMLRFSLWQAARVVDDECSPLCIFG